MPLSLQHLLGGDFRKWYPTLMDDAASLDEVRLRQVFRALQENGVELDRLDAQMLAERFGWGKK